MSAPAHDLLGVRHLRHAVVAHERHRLDAREPAAARRDTSSARIAGASASGSFCSPSRGPTSQIITSTDVVSPEAPGGAGPTCRACTPPPRSARRCAFGSTTAPGRSPAWRRDRRGRRLARRDRPRARREGDESSRRHRPCRRRRPPRPVVARGASTSPASRSLHVSDRTFLMHLRREDRGRAALAGEDARRPVDGLHPGRRSRLPGDRRRPEEVWTLTTKQHMVAVVTDGSAVLGLGDIGPEAALPVMEGKSMLFKEFGEVDAFPICLATQDPDEIVASSRRSLPASAASTSRTSPRRAASRSRSACEPSSTSPSSTTTSTARRSSSSQR